MNISWLFRRDRRGGETIHALFREHIKSFFLALKLTVWRAPSNRLHLALSANDKVIDDFTFNLSGELQTSTLRRRESAAGTRCAAAECALLK